MRIAIAYLCLAVFFGFLVLWMQSHYVYLTLQCNLGDSLGICLYSSTGHIGCEVFNTDNLSFWQGFEAQNADQATYSTFEESLWAFDLYRQNQDIYISVPYWLLVLIAGGFSIFLKPKPKFKFQLRELLIVLTIAAVVLGSILVLERQATPIMSVVFK